MPSCSAACWVRLLSSRGEPAAEYHGPVEGTDAVSRDFDLRGTLPTLSRPSKLGVYLCELASSLRSFQQEIQRAEHAVLKDWPGQKACHESGHALRCICATAGTQHL